MAEITVFKAERTQAIEDSTVVDARLDGDDLILVTRDETEINVGSVRGPQGDEGPGGDMTGPVSSVDGKLPVFDGVSGAILREGDANIDNIAPGVMIALVQWLNQNGIASLDGTDTLSDELYSQFVIVNSSMSLCCAISAARSVTITGGAAIRHTAESSGQPVNSRIGHYLHPSTSGTLSFNPTGHASYRRIAVVANFLANGTIVPVLVQGSASAVSYAASTLPALGAGQATVAILNVFNDSITSITDSRVLSQSGTLVGPTGGLALASTRFRDGQIVYDTTTDKLLVKSDKATAPIPPWNLPWGILAAASINATSAPSTGSSGSEIDVTGLAASVTVPAGRRLRVSFGGMTYSTVAGELTAVAIHLNAAAVAERVFFNVPAGLQICSDFSHVITPPAGTHALKVRLRHGGGSGSSHVHAGGLYTSQFTVEDIGPA